MPQTYPPIQYLLSAQILSQQLYIGREARGYYLFPDPLPLLLPSSPAVSPTLEHLPRTISTPRMQPPQSSPLPVPSIATSSRSPSRYVPNLPRTRRVRPDTNGNGARLSGRYGKKETLLDRLNARLLRVRRQPGEVRKAATAPYKPSPLSRQLYQPSPVACALSALLADTQVPRGTDHEGLIKILGARKEKNRLDKRRRRRGPGQAIK